jgi:5,10-methylenetetrahydromethanopterin reductase
MSRKASAGSSSRAPEWWILGWPTARHSSQMAMQCEAAGWDGFLLTDTQCLAHDSYVQLAMCVARTERIKLGTGVTNPVTRDVAVMASAVATLQEESEGRMHVGIGRGDSSLAYIGRPPAPLSKLESYLESLQSYLRGEVVDRDGFDSRLTWLSETERKVPVDVAGTGPRVTRMAARLADGITFAVGADPDRLRKKVVDVEGHLRDVGRTRDDFTISAYLNCAVSEDLTIARDIVRGTTSVVARFSGMHGGKAAADMTEEDRGVVVNLAREYDMMAHASSAASHARNLPDGFLDRFAVVGNSEVVEKRLRELVDTGIDRVVLVWGSRDADMKAVENSVSALSTEVLPAIRTPA